MSTENGHAFEPIETLFVSIEEALANQQAQFASDAAILRFEIAFALIWKAARWVLELEAPLQNSPLPVIRELAVRGWITDSHTWEEFVNHRNLVPQSYQAEVALQIRTIIPHFLSEGRKLIETLKPQAR